MDEEKDAPDLEGLEEADQRKPKKVWKENQRRVCAALRQRVNRSLEGEIENEGTISKILAKLEGICKPQSGALFTDLQEQFDRLSLSDYDNVTQFSDKLKQLHDQITGLDATSEIGAPQLLNRFLTGLGPAYAHWKTAFLQSNNVLPTRENNEIKKHPATLSYAIMKAQEEEMSQKKGPFETALLGMDNRRPTKKCTHPKCGKQGHTRDECWFDHPELRTQFLSRQGHRQFPKRRREGSNANDTPLQPRHSEVAALAGGPQQPTWEPPVWTFMARSSKNFASIVENLHILDSGASRHTFCRLNNFRDLRPYDGPKVTGIGGINVTPEAIGTYRLYVAVDGRNVPLDFKNALLAPSAGVNLISVSTLANQGAKIIVEGNQASIEKDGKTAMAATIKHGVYVINEPDITPALAALDLSDPDFELWHERLGHLSKDGINKLATMSSGIRPIQGNTCEGCARG